MTMLKPCPFCGGEARLKSHKGLWRMHHGVGCSTKLCIGFLHNFVPSTGFGPNSFVTEKEAIHTWNTRSDINADLVGALKAFIHAIGDEAYAQDNQKTPPSLAGAILMAAAALKNHGAL